MSKFDIILLYCFTLTVVVIAANFYLITHEYMPFDSSMWQFLTAAVTGEIIMFSLYEIATKARLKTPKNAKGKHAYIADIAAEDESKKEGINDEEQALQP